MNQQAHTVMVDGVEYTFYRLSVRVLNKILARAVKVLGKSFIDNLDEDIGTNAGELAIKTVQLLADNLDEDMLDKTIVEILSATECTGKGLVKEKFDIIFDRKIIHMYKVVAEAFKYYFDDFFGEGSMLQDLQEMAQKFYQKKNADLENKKEDQNEKNES